MRSFRLGSVLGIEIRIDASWFVIFLLILWTFSREVFPKLSPDLPGWAHVAMGLVGALLFFSSLLAHELSHSVVARRRGIPVEGITLFIFGGMARTRMESRSPGEELVIAGVGPLSSVVIGLIFGAIWWVGDRLGWTPALTGLAEYLAVLNVALAVFNLLPGFPLDGGRLLRAALWKATGSLRKATRVATLAGMVLGGAGIVYGLVQVFQAAQRTGSWQAIGEDWISGVWLALVGWFVVNAARSSFRQFSVVHALDGAPASEAMTRWPQTVPPEMTLEQLVGEHVRHSHFEAYPVVGPDGRAVGLIALSQLRRIPQDEWPTRTVREIMTATQPVLEVTPDESMGHVLDKLQTSAMGMLLVIRDGRLEGVITPADVAGWIKRAQQLKRV